MAFGWVTDWKTCARCQKTKPVTKFPKRLRDSLDGYHQLCKACLAQDYRRMYEKKDTRKRVDHRKRDRRDYMREYQRRRRARLREL